MKKFAVIKKESGVYKSTKVISNSAYLDMLTTVFTDRLSFAKDVKNELLNPTSQGRTGNEIDVDIDNSQVNICYCFSDYCITIDRQQLIKIMDKAIALMEAEAEYIVLAQKDENSSIEVSDQPPQGMEFFIEDKELRAMYLGKKY
jgi:hypothetical protein